MTMSATATRPVPRPAGGWLLVVNEHEFEQLYHPDDELPRFKIGIRPDDQDRLLVYDQGVLLGVLLSAVDAVDYTHHSGRLAWWEITYDPRGV